MNKIAPRLYMAASRFSLPVYKNPAFSHSNFLLLLCQIFPRHPYHEISSLSSSLPLPKHHQTTNSSSVHSQSITIHHNFPKLHKTSFSPSSLTTNGLQSTKHPLKESHQPQAIHKQSQTPSYRIQTTRKRHSFLSMTKPKSSTKP